MAEFATEAQMATAETALQGWFEQHPAAAAQMQELWKVHYMEIGHKRLGRLLLGRQGQRATLEE
jgi:hypothetical protein